MAEQCCVCDEKGENQCPNDATWQTWDQDQRYADTVNNYCDTHILDGLVENGYTVVCDAALLDNGLATGA